MNLNTSRESLFVRGFFALVRRKADCLCFLRLHPKLSLTLWSNQFCSDYQVACERRRIFGCRFSPTAGTWCPAFAGYIRAHNQGLNNGLEQLPRYSFVMVDNRTYSSLGSVRQHRTPKEITSRLASQEYLMGRSTETDPGVCRLK